MRTAMMTRTQIQFTDEQLRALRTQAGKEEVSVSKLVRTAVDAFLRSGPEPSREELVERALRAVGQFASGEDDIAVNHDKYLAEAYLP